MKVHINNSIHITGLASKQTASVKKVLTLPNPVYNKMKNMGKPTWGTEVAFKYWKETDGVITIPRGMVKSVKNLVGEGVNITTAYVNTPIKEKLVSQITMRDYQVNLVKKMLSVEEGILHAGTGTGKSYMAVEMVARLGLTATVVVPNKALMYQFAESFKKGLGYDVGLFGDGKKILKDITVVTVQSLSNEQNMMMLVPHTSVLIVDECHTMVSTVRAGLLRKFRPSRLYGLTATPLRGKDDGRTLAIQFIFGRIEAVYEKTQMTPRVEMYKLKYPIEFGEYFESVENMVQQEDRNKFIAKLIVGEIVSGKKVLVLTKRIAHYRNIEKLFNDKTGHFYIDSKDKQRNETLSGLRDGSIDYRAVFGTTSLLAVGVDIPSFDTLFLICDMKSEVLLTQSAGRILRVFEGKPEPLIIDMWDTTDYRFNNHARERRKLYKQKNWKCRVIGGFDPEKKDTR